MAPEHINPDQLMADIKQLAEQIANEERDLDTARDIIRGREKKLVATRDRFAELLGQATDSENALIFHGHAWWVAGNNLCQIRLWEKPQPR